MKKIYFILTLLLCAIGLSAQTLLDEDFEIDATQTVSSPIAVGDGWTTVNSYTGTKSGYNWGNYYSEKGTIGGKHCAYCDGPTYDDGTGEGQGPREEILLTPELDLNDTYQLSFDWIVSPMNAYESSLYDIQVRIVTGDVSDAETIFSIQNKEDLKESGVNTFPISTWDTYTSKLDLSDWKGEKVKIAFVYKMYTTVANIVWLDNVSVKKFTPQTSPVATINNDRYNFGEVYVGEKFYTTVFNLKNTGLKGLQVSSVELPSGVGITKDLTTINLDRLESVDFQLSYSATLFTPTSGNAVIHTNGGDITIALSATKKVVPEGYTLENFELYFPPAGWKNDGWSGTKVALEGDRSAYATGSYSDNYLISPRLDLTNGGSVTFSYYNYFEDEDNEYYQSNDISLELSTDGGETWEQKWIFNYEDLTKGETVTVDLGEGTDNSYVRWHNTAVETDDDGAAPFSSFYLDRVLLPKLYGADGVPDTTYVIKPADGSFDIYNKNIVLEWGPAQFATGYKLYVGSNDDANNLIDGMDLGNALTYTIPQTAYETLYKWKVVPYNTQGNAQNVPVWRFKTQKDASTADYPYVEDFSSDKLPTGWLQETNSQYKRKWTTNNIYGNDAPCLYITWMYNGEYSAVSTQEFNLPTGKSMAISFDWGDEHPSDLLVDESGLLKKENVEPNNGVGLTVFEILVDGEWKELSHLSENYLEDGDHKYWRKENIDLSEYAGKTVQFRWTNYSFSGKHNGAALDNVVIEEVLGDKAEFNKPEWKAGKVNYEKAVNSGEVFTILNKGVNILKIKSVEFENDNFTSTLAAGDEILPESGEVFALQFNAGQTNAALTDEMTVTFESGYAVSLPVSGEALAEGDYYYAFELNPLDNLWSDNFTTIDADNAISFQTSGKYITWDKLGTRFAFDVADESEMNYVMSPISGTHCLVAASPADAAADNWVISRKMTATETSKFDFYGRNWECLQSVLPSANHRITVLVSEKSNTKTSDFVVVQKEQEMPLLDGHNWNHYIVDLSQYAGKQIYVALRHTTIEASNLAFFDDFTFVNFKECSEEDGIQSVDLDNEEVVVYAVNGTMLKAGKGKDALANLEKGVYIVKVGQKSFKVTK